MVCCRLGSGFVLRKSNQVLLAVVVFLIGSIAHADENFPGVQSLMSETQFRDSGLDQLTPAQIAALNEWLIDYTAQDAALMARKVEKIRKRSEVIISEVVGEFDGWSGDTRFTLANGQIWKQRLDGRWRYRGDQPVTVEIRRNRLGFYKLNVAGHSRKVGVSRVE